MIPFTPWLDEDGDLLTAYFVSEDNTSMSEQTYLDYIWPLLSISTERRGLGIDLYECIRCLALGTHTRRNLRSSFISSLITDLVKIHILRSIGGGAKRRQVWDRLLTNSEAVLELLLMLLHALG